MKITIKADFDYLEEEQDLEITNEGLDNENFVSIYYKIPPKYDIGEEAYDYQEFTVSVEDAYRAFELFNKIRLEHKKYDN